MNPKDYRSILTEHNVEALNSTDNISLDAIIKEVKLYTSKKCEADGNSSKSHLESIITDYIIDNVHNWNINSYKDENGNIDRNKLTEIVIDTILNFGILQGPLEDPEITEIQGIGRWILVVNKKGKSEWLTDEEGNKLFFSSPEDQISIINKLFEGDQTVVNNEFRVVNGRTIQGYRLAVTHGSAVSKSEEFVENGFCIFTLRKFSENVIQLEQMVENGSFSDSMANLLSFLISNESLAVIGSTGSGKTTLLRGMLEKIPPMDRVICIQQPTESELRIFKENPKTGQKELTNNRVMWEADEGAKGYKETGEPIKHTNTLNNLMTACLRNTPKIIAVNEVRHPDECQSAILIGQAGHIVNLTFHARNPQQGCAIFTNKVMTVSHQSYDVALMDTCNTFRFMICQVLLEDGSRKITRISEILGTDPKDRNQPLINDIYKFEVTDTIRDKDGNLQKIIGTHKKVGNLSEDFRETLSLKGIIGEYLEKIDPDYKKEKAPTYGGKSMDEIIKKQMAEDEKKKSKKV